MLTPVILVCVHDLEDNLAVNHNLLYSMFSSYGTIQRILIFERSNTLKSFIEFDNAQSALEARKKLNRVMLFDGKYRISIYPSNLQTIKFQNNFPGGVDYTLMRKAQNFENLGNMQQTFMPTVMSMSPDMYYNDNYLRYQVSTQPKKAHREGGSSRSYSSSSSNSFSEHEGSFDEDDILQRINKHQKEVKVYDSETAEMGSEREDNDEAEDFNSLCNAFSNHAVFDNGKNDSLSFNNSLPQEKLKTSSSCSYLKNMRRLPCFPSSQTEIPSFEHYSFSLSPANSERSMSRLYSIEDFPIEHNDEKFSQPLPINAGDHADIAYQTDVNASISSDKGKTRPSQLNDSQPAASDKQDQEEEKKSPVLHVLGIESKEVTARMLFNVFSNFGNIMKLIFIKTRAVALIEFDNTSSAKIARDSLNNIAFMGKPLRITFSKYQTIQLEPGQNEKYPDQLILGDQNNSRFKDGRNVVVATPSTTLHISNLTKETCKDKKTISNFLGAYGEIKGIKCLIGENGKNMCLVRMKSVEECLQVMAHLHDTELGGRKVQISFSRSKI